MKQVQCKSGRHYYDPSKHSTCPYCGVQGLDMAFTQPRFENTGSKNENLKRCNQGHLYDPAVHTSCPACRMQTEDINLTRPKIDWSQHKAEDDNKTRAFFEDDTGFNPVVGWLVCIEGPDQGKDYRIHTEKNSIGRSEKMSIIIKGDKYISRDNHAFIIFNPMNNIFRIKAGESQHLVYLNNEEVESSMDLKAYDVIRIGQSKLMFIPFCSEFFKWQ